MENDSIYDILDESRKMIRILKILSTAPNISCELKVVSLDDSPVFSALSYMWGDATITESIKIDGKAIPVTVNLANAIRGIQHQWAEGECSEEPLDEQWLWADAICINQQDDQEKNYQVPLMAHIFSSARRVFCWLGPKDETTYSGFEKVLSASVEIYKLPSTHEVLEKLEDERVHDLDPELLHAFGDLDWLEKFHNTDTKAGIRVFGFGLMKEIFDHPYWKRLWVFQEVVLASEAVVVCGARAIPWLLVKLVRSWIGAVHIRYVDEGHPRIVPLLEWKELERCYHTIHYWRFDSAKVMVKKRRVLHTKEASTRDRTGFPLIRYAPSCRASNPKDYVYALQGISGDRIQTDYSAQKTVAQVYQDYAAHWLGTCITDPERSSLGICDLWFLELAGVGFFRQALPGLPSWAPDFAGVAQAIQQDHGPLWVPVGRSADKCVFSNNCPVPKLARSTLSCVAVFAGQVSALGPCINPSYDALGDTLWRWMFDYAMASTTRDVDRSLALKVIVKSLCYCRFLNYPEKKRGKILEFLLTDLEYVLCTETKAMSRTYFCDSLHLRNPPSNEFVVVDGLVERWFDAAPSPEDLHDTTKLEYRNLKWDLANLRMAKTSWGGVGIFPPLIQKDDVVCILKGFSLPAVLRKSEDHYTFVGGCCIQGLMEGEVGDWLRDGRARMEEIEIR